jgi:hypothetical protein
MSSSVDLNTRAPIAVIDDLVQAFSAPVDLSRLDIEPRQSPACSYRESRDGIVLRGYTRHLTPRETSAVHMYKGNNSRILAVQEDMRVGFGEWLHASLRAFGNEVMLAPGFLDYPSGVMDLLRFQVPKLSDTYETERYALRSLPSDLASALWLSSRGVTEDAGLYFTRNGVWCPLGLGENGVSIFSFPTKYTTRASRGVRVLE